MEWIRPEGDREVLVSDDGRFRIEKNPYTGKWSFAVDGKFYGQPLRPEYAQRRAEEIVAEELAAGGQ